MSSAAAHDAGQDHGEEIHLPEPSLWPFVVAIGMPMIPAATLLWVYDARFGGPTGPHIFPVVLILGVIISLIGCLGWMTSVIREKETIDIAWGNRALSLAWKLFLVSEGAIFFVFFLHYYYTIYQSSVWPPKGTPHISPIIPAIGTIILMSSSLTCEIAHKCLIRGRRSASKNWLLLTIGLGLVFLSLQGFEWGHLQASEGFTITSGYIGTIFYLVTGFHGAHVIIGIMLLYLVFTRFEMGSFDRKRHFSMNAASWYWHFVDVIWIFVFLSLYLGVQPR
ncbi:cytochrome c oxidase subunit 3 [soil metagenome]